MRNDKWHIHINWMFLLFLAGATYVKLYIKVAAIIIYLGYCVYKKFSFHKIAGVHWFYLLMPVAGIGGALLHDSFINPDYLPAAVFGISHWVAGGTIAYLLYITVRNISSQAVHSTIKAFFAINALISLGELGKMIIDSGHLIPYWYWGANLYYGGATGDHIYGITGSISVTNAMLCALGSLYFIFRKELKWVLLCIIISILCTSNVTLLLLSGVLLLLVLLYKDKKIKTYAAYALLTSAVLYPVLTYENIEYFGTVYTDDIKTKEYTEDELKTIQKIQGREWKEEKEYEVSAKIFMAKNTSYFKVRLTDSFATTAKSDLQYLGYKGTLRTDDINDYYLPEDIQTMFKRWYGIKHSEAPLSTFHKPVKLYSFMQTADYLLEDINNAVSGAGIGNFSSKQAIKTTGLGLQGSYPVSKLYVSKSFLQYHMYTLLYILGLPVAEHSIINMPNSMYNNIAGEYGVAGIIIFIIFYFGFFWGKRRMLKAGWYIALLSFAFFTFDYWFEMISLTVIFELLMFTEIYKWHGANE